MWQIRKILQVHIYQKKNKKLVCLWLEFRCLQEFTYKISGETSPLPI